MDIDSGKVELKVKGILPVSISPDGNLILLSVESLPAKDAAALWVAPIEDPAKKVILADFSNQFDFVAEARWSPNGAEVAFKGVMIDRDTQKWKRVGLYVYSIASKTLEEVYVAKEKGNLTSPAWSPDGSKIAFSTAPPPPGVGYWDIVVKDLATGQLMLATINGGYAAGQPNWSPDGTKIVHVTQFNVLITDYPLPDDIKDDPGIRVSKKGGFPRTVALTDWEGVNESAPSWSPDGRYIAFLADKEAKSTDILVVGADGQVSNLTSRFSHSPFELDWSSDGSSLVYVALVRKGYMYDIDNPGNSDIYVMSAKGGDPQRITNTSQMERYPKFSPSGKQIGFIRWEEVTKPGPGFGELKPFLFLIDIGGTDERKLSERFFWDFGWSPAGNEVIAVGQNGDKWDLVRLNVNTGETQVLITIDGYPRNPSWSPTKELIAYGLKVKERGLSKGITNAEYEISTFDMLSQSTKLIKRVYGDTFHLDLSWAGNGKYLTLMMATKPNFVAALYALDPETGTELQLLRYDSLGAEYDLTQEPNSPKWWSGQP